MPDKSYILVDEHGARRVGRSRVMFDGIAAAFMEGHSAETIQQQYPVLTLEEVYGSIAYFLGHPEEVKTYLQRQDALWKEWQTRCEQNSNPVVERLRSMRASKTAGS